MLRAKSAHISPSAHYTGYVWYRHRLSEPAFVTAFGRFAHSALLPITWAAKAVDIDLDRLLLQRHLLIDALLDELIEKQGVRQVVEIACGLSPRGRRFRQRHPEVRYIEADLPGMAARKRQLLHEQGWLNDRHKVQAVDILAEDGAHSLDALFSQLDPNLPVAVITEGLINYFDLATVEGFWSRLSGQLKRFPGGYYLSDIYPDFRNHPSYKQLRWGTALIGGLTRGSFNLHYGEHADIEQGLKQSGFKGAEIFDPHQENSARGLPRGRLPTLVRIILARA